MSRRVIFLQGPSKLLNPLLDQETIDAAYEDDPEAARSEWGGLFRSDVTAYLSDDTIDRALSPERSRPRSPDFEYTAFVDPAGGVAGGDEMTLAIAHQQRTGHVVLDYLLAVEPPFQTEEVVSRFAVVLSAYGLTAVGGDKYGGLWPAQTFQRHGISYIASELDKSALFREAAPLFVSGRVELLDDSRLETQLRLLERTPKAGGKPDAIDHPPGRGAHDDRINAVVGALWSASRLPWAGASTTATAMSSRHLSGLDYSPLERYAQELARAEAVQAKRGEPYGRH